MVGSSSRSTSYSTPMNGRISKIAGSRAKARAAAGCAEGIAAGLPSKATPGATNSARIKSGKQRQQQPHQVDQEGSRISSSGRTKLEGPA
ncbi:hypothetical protein Emed_001782 [Eimeria media]